MRAFLKLLFGVPDIPMEENNVFCSYVYTKAALLVKWDFMMKKQCVRYSLTLVIELKRNLHWPTSSYLDQQKSLKRKKV